MRTDLEIYQSLTPGWLHRQLGELAEGVPQCNAKEEESVVLIVDVSGFTALSERLAAAGDHGAETLTAYLNDYFDRVIGAVRHSGGDVLKMAGDGLLAAWPLADEDTASVIQQAVACAQRIQRDCHDYQVAAGEFLRVRVGVAVGLLTTVIAGGHHGRWEFLAYGPPVVAAGRAQIAAPAGAIVITREVRKYLGAQAEMEPLDDDLWHLVGWQGHAVDHRISKPATEPAPPLEIEAHALRGFVPTLLHDNLGTIRAGWLAEVRRVTVMFISLTDATATGPLAPSQGTTFQRLMHDLQETVHKLEGTINKWTSDEKGHGLLVAFGLPPISHQDDPLRAVTAALEIQMLLKQHHQPGRIGIATGTCYCGLVGNTHRQEYTLIGLAVNRAARLVQQPGFTILCDRPTYRHCDNLEFELLPPAELKGLHGPQELFQPRPADEPGPRRQVPSGESAPGFLAHGQAWAQLQQLSDDFNRDTAEGGLVIVEGAAGIGKSTLLQAWRDAVAKAGMTLISARAESLHRSTPYRLWQQVLRQLLDHASVPPEADDATRVEALLRGGSHGMLLAPLLNDVMPLGLPDTYLTAQMTGRLRADSLRQLIGTLVGRSAARGPLVFVLDDQHWCDASSIQLTQAVLQQSPSLLLVISTRPPEGDAPVRELYQTPEIRRVIRLEAFSQDEVAHLLRRHFECREVEPKITQFIHAKGHGNPLFSIEIANTLLETNSLAVRDGVCRVVTKLGLAAAEIPNSLQGVITERIDRLDPSTQMTAKVASIIGQRFDLDVLEQIHPLEPQRQRISDHLAALQEAEVIRPADRRQHQFDFSHALIHEAVYHLLLQSQRRQIHRAVAIWLEAHDASPDKNQAVLLAWHWRQAEEPLRAARLLGTAAALAVREGAYREGLDHVGQALDLSATATHSEAAATAVEIGGWLRLKAEALLGLGALYPAAVEFCAAAASLGHPVPEVVDAAAIRRRWRHESEHGVSLAAVDASEPGDIDIEQRRNLVFCYEVLTVLQLFSCQRAACVGMADLVLRLARPLGPGPELARALASVAVAAAILPDRSLADRFADAAVRLATSLDQIRTLSRVNEFVGMMNLGLARWQRVEASFVAAIDGFERVGDQRCRIECNCLYSTYQHYRGNFGRRVLLGMEVSDLAKNSGDQQGIGWGTLDQLESLIALGEFGVGAALAETIGPQIGISIVACDVIMAYGLMARLSIRTGDQPQALSHALKALELMRDSDPTIVYNLEAQAAPAEVMLACWRNPPPEGVPEPWADWREASKAALVQLVRFARVFPVARPRFQLWRGEWHLLNGNLPMGLHCLHKALNQAIALEMPYEEGLARASLARNLPPNDPEHALNLEKARELFKGMRADFDLAALVSSDGSQP